MVVGRVLQMVKDLAHVAGVAGSIPAGIRPSYEVKLPFYENVGVFISKNLQ